MTRPTVYSHESRSAPVVTLTVTSIPTGGVGSYTRSPKVGVTNASRSLWEELVFDSSAIATTTISPMATLIETTTVVGSVHILTLLRSSWMTLS